MGIGKEAKETRSPDVTTQTPSRALGVQSILNPPESRDGEAAAHASHVQQSPHQHLPQTAFLPPPAESPRIRKRNQRAASIDEAQSNTRSASARRTLTPISPSRRAESYGGRHQLPG